MKMLVYTGKTGFFFPTFFPGAGDIIGALWSFGLYTYVVVKLFVAA